MKINYLADNDALNLMKRVSGVSNVEQEGKNNLPRLYINKLIKNKYYDIILLCSVAAAFGTLLMVSLLG
jgi:hypothetical protein